MSAFPDDPQNDSIEKVVGEHELDKVDSVGMVVRTKTLHDMVPFSRVGFLLFIHGGLDLDFFEAFKHVAKVATLKDFPYVARNIEKCLKIGEKKSNISVLFLKILLKVVGSNPSVVSIS